MNVSLRRFINLSLLLALFVAGCGGSSGSQSTAPTTSSSNTGIFYDQSIVFKNVSTVLAFGYNGNGQLGDSTLVNRATPVRVVGINSVSTVSAVAVGANHALALLTDTTVISWGLNSLGQLGSNPVSTPSTATPQKVPNLIGVTALAAGGNHSLALMNDTTVKAWGSNSYGQLGVDVTKVPVGFSKYSSNQVVDGLTGAPLSGVVKIAAGGNHSLALLNNGNVMAWGLNHNGQLGNNSTVDSPSPVIVSGLPLTGITDIAAGGAFSLALDSSGVVWSWGYNGFGQLGNGTIIDSPIAVPVPIANRVTAIAAGLDHALALLADGTVMAWGFNYYGQLGNNGSLNSTVGVPTPVLVPMLSSVAWISAIGHHSLARTTSGAFWAWGYNAYGQLGNNSTVNSYVPVQVTLF